MDITEAWATRPADHPAYLLSRWLFLRLLGAVYLIAFVSLAVQVSGLLGERGILPAGSFLQRAHALYGGAAYRLFPTLCWLGAGDGMLKLLAWGGVARAEPPSSCSSGCATCRSASRARPFSGSSGTACCSRPGCWRCCTRPAGSSPA